MSPRRGRPRYPGGYADYIVNHERRPGVGSLAGWRGAARRPGGPRRAQPAAARRYIANGCFWKHLLPADQRYFKHANQAYLEFAVAMGFIESAAPIVLQLYVEPLQRFRLAAQGHGKIVPPATHRERIATYFDPLPFWYMPFEEALVDRDAFPLHALTQRPMHMYHSWDSQNAWLRQILGRNRLFINRASGPRARPRRRRLGVGHQPPRPDPRADPADGRGQPRHGVDLERHRQARRRLEPRARCARIPRRAFCSTI